MQQFKRDLYANASFVGEKLKGYACPDCGSLPLQKDAFERYERGATDHPDFDHTWLTLTFVARLKCFNPSCGRIVHCVGKGYVDEGHDQDEESGGWRNHYYDVFQPTFFEPPLVIFDIPEACPDAVAMCLRDSFRVFFASPTGALNEARSAIELLLDEHSVPRKKPTGGKLALADRIDWLSSASSSATSISPYAEFLDAVRALGNLGAHKNEVSISEVLDCYQMTMHLLDKLYSNRELEAAAIARSVNALHPRQKKGVKGGGSANGGVN